MTYQSKINKSKLASEVKWISESEAITTCTIMNLGIRDSPIRRFRTLYDLEQKSKNNKEVMTEHSILSTSTHGYFAVRNIPTAV